MHRTGDTVPTRSSACLEPLEGRRLMAFGQLDPSFGTGGRAVATLPMILNAPAALHELETTPSGAIVAGGSGGLVRWTPGGDVAADFGTDGVAPIDNAAYRDHAVGPDGDIFVLASSPAASVVIRYTSDGVPDTGFGGGSTAVVSTKSTFAPAAIAVQEDGKIVVAGAVRTDGGDSARTRVYRFEPDGTADLSFGSGASLDLQLGLAAEPTPVVKDAVTGLAILPGGRIVVGGSSLAYAPEFYDDAAGVYTPVAYGDSVFAVARLTADGAPDATYGEGGVSRAVYASGMLPAPASAFAHRTVDNAIGLAAYTDRLVYAQFNASGVVGFNVAADLPSFGRPLDMAGKADGRFVLVGVPEPLTGNGLQVAMIDAAGALGQIVQTGDARGQTVDLAEGAPAAVAVAQDGNLLIGGSPGDGSAAYQLVKMDDGDIDAARPDEFAEALGNDIVRDAVGGLHVAYFDLTNRVLRYAYRAPNGLWDAPVTVDPAPESGHYISIAVDANARPGIAYFDGNHGDLRYASLDAGGEWTTQLVEGRGSVGLYPSLQFDAAQSPTIAYYRKTGGDLKMAALRPDGRWAYEVIDHANDVGRAAVLAPQPMSGRWAIAYTDTTDGSVKYAWRTPRRAWQIETVATTVGGADFLSLAYNPFTEPAGVYQHPAISYFDAHAADVKIAQSSGDGALVWTSKLLASRGRSGTYSHLTFDALGGPTVYYYNRTNNSVNRVTDSYDRGLIAETLVAGAGRNLSVFSNGDTVDLAFFDEADRKLKVRSIPLRV